VSLSNIFVSGNSRLGPPPVSFTFSQGTSYGVTFNPGSCSGGGCTDVTDAVTFTFSGLQVGRVNFGGFSEIGNYSADYSGILPCASGDGSSGQSDCLIWNGSSASNNTGFFTKTLTADGETLDVTFHNASDWDIKPTVSFTVTDPAVPEASTWAMMLLGFAGLGYAGFRSRKTAISIA
jgi:PEP-CTERM motif